MSGTEIAYQCISPKLCAEHEWAALARALTRYGPTLCTTPPQSKTMPVQQAATHAGSFGVRDVMLTLEFLATHCKNALEAPQKLREAPKSLEGGCSTHRKERQDAVLRVSEVLPTRFLMRVLTIYYEIYYAIYCSISTPGAVLSERMVLPAPAVASCLLSMANLRAEERSELCAPYCGSVLIVLALEYAYAWHLRAGGNAVRDRARDNRALFSLPGTGSSTAKSNAMTRILDTIRMAIWGVLDLF
eukprot:2962191-Rhodomonas_salina.1